MYGLRNTSGSDLLENPGWFRKEFYSSPKQTTMFLVSPKQLKTLNMFDLPKKELSSSFIDNKPGLRVLKNPHRWLIFCVAPTQDEQIKLLTDLAKEKQMPGPATD